MMDSVLSFLFVVCAAIMVIFVSVFMLVGVVYLIRDAIRR